MEKQRNFLQMRQVCVCVCVCKKHGVPSSLVTFLCMFLKAYLHCNIHIILHIFHHVIHIGGYKRGVVCDLHIAKAENMKL